MPVWTTPKTYTALELETAADWNTYLRDNLGYLKQNYFAEALACQTALAVPSGSPLGTSLAVNVNGGSSSGSGNKTGACLIVWVTAQETISAATPAQINVKWDGTLVESIIMPQSVLSSHFATPPMARYLNSGQWTTGGHTLRLEVSGNTTWDSNDFCTAVLIGV